MKIRFLLIAAVLITAILGFGVPAETSAAGCMLQFSSLSTADKISCLQQAISDLMAQLQEFQGAGSTWCHTFNTNMGYGASGADFDALITVLDRENIMEFTSSNRPAQYDENIGGGIVKLQAKYGIMQTGYFGPLTRAKVNALYGCGATCVGEGGTATISPISANTTHCCPGLVEQYPSGISDGSSSICVKPVTQPYITVTSPNGGEQWEIGKSYHIQWGYSGQNVNYAGAKTAIHLLNTNGVYKTIYNFANEGDQMNLDRYWTIPADIPVGSYKIQVVLYDRPGNTLKLDDISDNYFSIAAAATYSCFSGCYDVNKDGYVSSQDMLLIANLVYTTPTKSDRCTGGSKYDLNKDINKDGCIDETDTNCIAADLQANGSHQTTCGASAQPSVTVTSPNGGETWDRNKTYDITWSTVGYGSDADVALVLYENSGSLPVYNTFKYLKNTGSYKWTMPSSFNVFPLKSASDKYKIRVDIKNSGAWNWETNDISDNYFTITCANNWQCSAWSDCTNGKQLRTCWDSNSCGVLTSESPVTAQDCTSIPTVIPSITSMSPTSGTDRTIVNVYGNGFSQTAKIIVGGTYLINPSNVASDGKSLSFTIPIAFIPVGTYQIGVTNSDASRLSNTLPFIFTTSATPVSINILSPNGGESWRVGETHRITWNSSGVEKVRLYVYIPDRPDLGSGSTNYISDIIPNIGYYNWTIVSNVLPLGSTLPHNYKIRVDDLDNGSGNVTVRDSSDNYFSIAAATTQQPTWNPRVTFPIGGELFIIGRTYNITWNSDGWSGASATMKPSDGKVVLNVLDYTPVYSATDPARVVASIPNVSDSQGTYSWTVPSSITSGTKFRVQVCPVVSGVTSSACYASNNVFTIAAPGPIPVISSISPNSAEAQVGPAVVRVDIYGSGFTGDSVVKLDNGATQASLDTGFISSTHLQAIISGLVYVSGGSHSITVTNLDGQVSNSASFSVTSPLPPPPHITSVDPNWVFQNVTKVLNIYGTGFRNGAVVMIDSSRDRSINTTFVSSTQMQTTINTDSKSGYFNLGTHYITIEQGTEYSNTIPFSVTNQKPSYNPLDDIANQLASLADAVAKLLGK